MRHLEKPRSAPLIIFILLVFMGIASTVKADVMFVSGDVSGVWSADSVFVTDSIYVSPGNTLVIEPGVRVLFLSWYYFTVNDGAVLQAVGTEADSIYFLIAVDGFSTLGIDFLNASDESILEYCYFSHALYSAIALTNSDITIRHCLIEDNSGHYRGGGISALEGSDALIEYNIIRNNSTIQDGGGIYCDASSPIIRGNIIDNNSSGPIAAGGGISCANHSHPLIVDNTITNNQVFPSPIYPTTVGQGAAIFCANLCNPVIRGNLFSNNRVNSGGAVGQGGGGAIFVSAADPVIENNVFAGNVVEYGDGGALYLFIYNGTLLNNVFTGNTAARDGGAIYMDLSDPSVINSVLYGDNAPDGPELYLYGSSEVTVSYSDIEGGWEGEGNIDVDPLFRDPIGGDYHLQDSVECGDQYYSPCIDAGSPDFTDSLLDCSWGLGTELSDIGAYGGGDSLITAVTEDGSNVPQEIRLVGNYPNPFNASTNISFIFNAVDQAADRPTHVTLNIYNMLGQKVRTLVDGTVPPGTYYVIWDARSEQGEEVASGLYLYKLRTGEVDQTMKMILLR